MMMLFDELFIIVQLGLRVPPARERRWKLLTLICERWREQGNWSDQGNWTDPYNLIDYMPRRFQALSLSLFYFLQLNHEIRPPH